MCLVRVHVTRRWRRDLNFIEKHVSQLVGVSILTRKTQKDILCSLPSFALLLLASLRLSFPPFLPFLQGI